jgi:hypothetical protein
MSAAAKCAVEMAWSMGPFSAFSVMFLPISVTLFEVFQYVQRRAVGVEHRVGILLIFVLFHAKQI